jgi:hypothetical protein
MKKKNRQNPAQDLIETIAEHAELSVANVKPFNAKLQSASPCLDDISKQNAVVKRVCLRFINGKISRDEMFEKAMFKLWVQFTFYKAQYDRAILGNPPGVQN